MGTPLDRRTAPLNRKREWRDWSGYLAASQYDYLHIHEYVGIRHAAVLIDVSPLYKYRISGRDAVKLIDRVITRDATKIKPGQVVYTPWCDEHGKVIDDGTIARLDDDTFRWTSAEPHLRWFGLNARGLDVEIEDDQREDRRDRAAGTVGTRSAGRLSVAPTGPTCASTTGDPPASARSASTSVGPATPATWATSCGSTRRRRTRYGIG